MAFNPLKEKGTPLEKQYRNWEKLNVRPFDKNSVSPYTRTRVILMNGVEVEAAMYLHQLTRNSANDEVNQMLAVGRRIEQQQQKIINWLNPGDQSVLETTIGYEQVAVDLTAWLAKHEPDPYVKAALDFALLEDFDHLYRYANLMDMTMGIPAESIVHEYTEIFPGRPTISEHRHPFDTLSRHIDNKTADIQTKLNIQLITAGEQQTMNFYMNVGATQPDMLARGLYQEIAMIEEEHVTHYETLADPLASWWEKLLIKEYMECWIYYSFMNDEPSERIRAIWEQCLMDEIEHLKMAGELLKRFDKKDPAMFIPEDVPSMMIFESNKDYVRDLLAKTVDQTKDKTEFVDVLKLPGDHRYHKYQDMVNSKISVPSQQVIEDHIKIKGTDYRLETEGEHPVARFREKTHAVK